MAESEATKSDSSASSTSGSSSGDAASSYSRGENQKPVSKTYRNNWNAIFGKKKPSK